MANDRAACPLDNNNTSGERNANLHQMASKTKGALDIQGSQKKKVAQGIDKLMFLDYVGRYALDHISTALKTLCPTGDGRIRRRVEQGGPWMQSAFIKPSANFCQEHLAALSLAARSRPSAFSPVSACPQEPRIVRDHSPTCRARLERTEIQEEVYAELLHWDGDA